MLSISMELSIQGCRHYISWYDQEKEDIVRSRVETQEDVYEMILQLENVRTYTEYVGVRELYQEKYQEQMPPVLFELDLDGTLLRNDSPVAEYQDTKLEKQLAKVEITI